MLSSHLKIVHQPVGDVLVVVSILAVVAVVVVVVFKGAVELWTVSSNSFKLSLWVILEISIGNKDRKITKSPEAIATRKRLCQLW